MYNVFYAGLLSSIVFYSLTIEKVLEALENLVQEPAFWAGSFSQVFLCNVVISDMLYMSTPPMFKNYGVYCIISPLAPIIPDLHQTLSHCCGESGIRIFCILQSTLIPWPLIGRELSRDLDTGL